MGCTMFITMLTIGLLQLQGLKSLPVESAAPVLPCTLQEATEINQKHLQEGQDRINSINTDATEVLNDVNEQIEKLVAERTSAGQELLAALQTTLDQEIQSKPESIDCLSALQIQVDVASARSNYNLAKCTIKTQQKGLKLKNTIAKVQQKMQSIQNKAVSSIGRCAISYYPYGSCADLDACCEIEKNKSLLKVDKYAIKIKYSAEEIVMDVDECLTEAVAETQKYVLYVTINILNCSAPQAIAIGPNSGESVETDEEVADNQETGNEQGDVEAVAPQVPSVEEPQQPGQSQGPQAPEGAQKPEETQEPQQPQEPQDPQQPEQSQGAQAPEEAQKPVDPQEPQQPEQPQGPQDPQQPEQSQGPQAPEEAQKPVVPQEPQQPEQPQGPQDPQAPEEAQKPVDPQESQQPEQSQGPQESQEPQIPQESQGTENVQEPQAPQDPQTPEEPQGPQEPQQPEPEQVVDLSNQSGGNQSGANQGPSK